MSAPPVVSVIVPITGADAHPERIAEEFGSALRDSGYQSEFVFVIDGVVGPAEERLDQVRQSWPVVVVRLQGGGLGESIALSAGVAKTSGDLIINAPPYLQIEPEDIVKVVIALESGADCVATWRNPRVDPWLNRLQSSLFNRVLRVLMGIPFHDLNSSTRGFRRQVLEEVNVYGELYRFLPVLALRQGFRVVEVKVRHREEKGRRGFYGFGVYVRRFLDILAITFLTRFTQRPLRFFGYLGLAAMVIGMVMCAEPLFSKLFVEGAGLQDRPLFVIGAILTAFGVQLIGFGLVGEIVIFTQSPNLRDYKIDEIVEEERGEEVEPSAATDATEPGQAPTPGGSMAQERHNGEELPLRVREILPGEDSRWDAFVQRHPQGQFFHLSGWRRVIHETFRHQPHYLVLERGRRWLGILPLFFVKSPFLGRNLVSVPYGVYGGVLAEDEACQQHLLDEAAALGRSVGAGYVELRHLEQRPGDRPGSDLYVTFFKDLPDDSSAILPSIPKKARAEVRRARDRFEIAFEESDDLAEFFALFAENKRRLGSPSLPARWFRALREEFGRQIVLHRAVSAEGETYAAVMSFCYKNTVHVYYSGSKTGINKTGVNDYIYWRIMEWAVNNGYSRFDFGRSRTSSGPAAFKKNMGFDALPLHYEYLLVGAGASLPEFHPSNPKLDLPRRIWSSMPMFLANRLGARLSRYLP